MKALISPNENFRVCQIEQEPFPVAEPLFWTDCPDNVTTNWSYSDGEFIEPIIEVVEPEVTPTPTAADLLAQLQAIQAQIAALGA